MGSIYLRLFMLRLALHLCGGASTPTADLLKFQFAGPSAQRKGRCQFTCDNSKRRPVCGTDGRTYPSQCELQRARSCRQLQVDVASQGRCPGSVSKCVQERAKAQEFSREQPGSLPFIPRCKADGGYQEVQCHEATGYCWCVTMYGRPIPDTAKSIPQSPNCRGRNVRRGSGIDKRGTGVDSSGCSRSDRNKFNANLTRIFYGEYQRIPRGAATSKASKVSGTANLEVIRWKFRQLDVDGDRRLKKKEVRNLRRMLKKLVRPKSCAKSFSTYCDSNSDRRITEPEWTACLQIRPIKQVRPTTPAVPDRIRGGQSPGRRVDQWEKRTGLRPRGQENEVRRTTPKQNEKKDCSSERNAAQQMNQTEPNSKIFIPVCTGQGLYQPAQCHTGYCWCVDTVTGKPLPGTSTRNVKPQCNETRLRPMKECPYHHKRAFLQLLLDVYTTQITEYASNNTHSSSMLNLNPKHSIEERAVRWKFQMLDTNKNSLIDKREKRYLKKDLRNIKPKRKRKAIRRCSREFLSFCDQNSDKAITMAEWLDCTGVKEQQRKNLPTNPNRKGPNPFKKWLRSTGS